MQNWSPLKVDVVLASGDFYYTWNGRPVRDLSEVPKGAVLQAHDRLRGGKGGFGSMLRAIGNQIEKTTNHEMCRDLTGRRMRDVNTEKKLQEWYAKANDREREKMQRYNERRQRRQELLAKGPLPGHKFSDREYERQKRKIDQDLQSALDAAVSNVLKEKKQQQQSSSDVAGPSCSGKKPRLWINEEEEKLLLSDSSLSDSSIGAVSSDSEPGAQDAAHSPPPYLPASTTPSSDPKSADELAIHQSPSPAECTAQPSEPQSEPPAPNLAEVRQEEPKTVTVEPVSDAALGGVSTVAELEELGLDVLKESLTVRGLKCGGSLGERAIRLFSVRGLAPDEYPAKIRAKPKRT